MTKHERLMKELNLCFDWDLECEDHMTDIILDKPDIAFDDWVKEMINFFIKKSKESNSVCSGNLKDYLNALNHKDEVDFLEMIKHEFTKSKDMAMCVSNGAFVKKKVKDLSDEEIHEICKQEKNRGCCPNCELYQSYLEPCLFEDPRSRCQNRTIFFPTFKTYHKDMVSENTRKIANVIVDKEVAIDELKKCIKESKGDDKVALEEYNNFAGDKNSLKEDEFLMIKIFIKQRESVKKLSKDELDKLYKLLMKLKDQRIAEQELDHPGFKDLHVEEQYELDDGDRLLECLDVVIGIVEEM